MSVVTFSDTHLVVATYSILVLVALMTFVFYTYYMTWNSRWWWKKREKSPFIQVWNGSSGTTTATSSWIDDLIHGTVQPGWEPVRDEFIENFRSRGELGAAVCIYFGGEKVVDLWGGYKDRHGTSGKWESDTLVNIFSTTKGITSLAVAMQHSKGKIDYDGTISEFWPEFGQKKIFMLSILCYILLNYSNF